MNTLDLPKMSLIRMKSLGRFTFGSHCNPTYSACSGSDRRNNRCRDGVAQWSSPSAHHRQVVGLSLVGTTFHKPKVNSAVHPYEIGK